jgi:serine/threonine-protein kinase
MVLVPEGPFLFGKDKQSATLPAFYIDKTEVTNEAYGRFSAEKGLPMRPGAEGERPEDPIVDVSFLQAEQFADWAGKRLPNTEEWEKAARGPDGRLYPWGNEAGEPPPANIGNPKGVMQVNSNPAGASPYGAVNMLGNVWEWVNQPRTPSELALRNFAALKPPPTATEPWYMIRGGAYSEKLLDSYLYDFATVPARHHAKNIGFRCVKTP